MITTYSNFRENLKAFLDEVISSRVPLFITRSKGEEVVVIPKSDFDSMQETMYLLNSATNNERLARGIAEYESGLGTKRELIE